MDHKPPRKTRPTPLKGVQVAAQVDESRRYLILDAQSPLPSPAHPFEGHVVPSAADRSLWRTSFNCSPTCTPPGFVSQLLDSLPETPPPGLVQVGSGVSLSPSTPNSTLNYPWDDSPDSHDDPIPLHAQRPYRSLTPPISPPALSPPGIDMAYPSKRSGMTFALIPAEVDGKHVFTHVVVNHQDHVFMDNSAPPSLPFGADGLPEDMQDILQQLDDLASWVKAASSSRHSISPVQSIVHATRLTYHPLIDAGGDSTMHLSDTPFPNKGKSRLPSTSLPGSECGVHQYLVESRSVMPVNSTNIPPGTDCPQEGFIYVPNCNTPEFLVGSSNSLIAYPVCGYSSHPSRHSPHPPGPTHNVSYHRRFLERRSAPCPPRSSLLLSPPLGKTSFKTLFQRSRCNTTAISHPSIPSGHVPVENALRQGKRMRLPWLKI